MSYHDSTEGQRLGAVCEHGSLARSCLVCELTAERDALRAEVERLTEYVVLLRRAEVDPAARTRAASNIDVSGPPVGSQTLIVDLGHVPKMNEDERQCSRCERVVSLEGFDEKYWCCPPCYPKEMKR